MRKIFTLTMISSFIFYSCNKHIEERITGNWKLEQVYLKKAFSKENIVSGYEAGVFTFLENGDARYVNGSDTLSGYWKAKTRSNTTYNAATGNTETSSAYTLKISLINFVQNKRLEWEFDDFDFKDQARRLRGQEHLISHFRVYEFIRQ